jgi:hypothetical protein
MELERNACTGDFLVCHAYCVHEVLTIMCIIDLVVGVTARQSRSISVVDHFAPDITFGLVAYQKLRYCLSELRQLHPELVPLGLRITVAPNLSFTQ